MAAQTVTSSPRAIARWAGLLYLVNAGCGLYAEAFVRGQTIAHGNPALTAANIVARQTFYRSGFAADLVSMLCEIGIAALLYILFRPVSRVLAATFVLFRLAWVAVFAAVALTHMTSLMLLTDPGMTHAFTPAQLDALSYLSLRLHTLGYNSALIFFGMDCVLAGILILRANFLPKPLGLLMALAGFCYLANSFADFLSPALSDALGIYLLLPCAVAEWSLALWLLVAGVDAEKWRAQAAL
ncbi:MAG: DUF4386 domain-containing protein [Rhizomicrobium sp.]